MKIDLGLIEKMVEAGASGSVVLAYLRNLDAKQAPRKAADRKRKSDGKVRKPAETERERATLDDSPRARLFREGGDILASLGRPDRGARALLAQWLKLTHDDAQLVLASLARARELGVADVAGWMLNTLNGKVKPNGNGNRSLAASYDDLIARAEEHEQQTGHSEEDVPF